MISKWFSKPVATHEAGLNHYEPKYVKACISRGRDMREGVHLSEGQGNILARTTYTDSTRFPAYIADPAFQKKLAERVVPKVSEALQRPVHLSFSRSDRIDCYLYVKPPKPPPAAPANFSEYTGK